jgi:putative endonuclease
VVDAIRQETRIKGWKRDWKLRLIEEANPDWRDLAAEWFPENDPDWVPPEEPD